MYLRIPWSQRKEFEVVLHSANWVLSRNHAPVLGCCFLRAELWFEDGSGDDSQRKIFPCWRSFKDACCPIFNSSMDSFRLVTLPWIAWDSRLTIVSKGYRPSNVGAYARSAVSARLNVALCLSIAVITLSTSLLSNGHFKARSPKCLILFGPCPGSSLATSPVNCDWHCCTGPSARLRRSRTDSLIGLEASARSTTFVKTSWSEVISSRRRWISFLASFTSV